MKQNRNTRVLVVGWIKISFKSFVIVFFILYLSSKIFRHKTVSLRYLRSSRTDIIRHCQQRYTVRHNSSGYVRSTNTRRVYTRRSVSCRRATEGNALHARFRGSFHVPFECPQLSRKSRLRRQTFLFSGGSFHCSWQWIASRQKKRFHSGPRTIIPITGKQTESERKKAGKKKRNKNQSSLSTVPDVVFDEVTPSMYIRT